MKHIAFGAAATVVLIGAAGTSAWAQRPGQSVAIQYGTVTAAREVDLTSGAVPAGVVVGGGLGLASASGKSSVRRLAMQSWVRRPALRSLAAPRAARKA